MQRFAYRLNFISYCGSTLTQPDGVSWNFEVRYWLIYLLHNYRLRHTLLRIPPRTRIIDSPRDPHYNLIYDRNQTSATNIRQEVVHTVSILLEANYNLERIKRFHALFYIFSKDLDIDDTTIDVRFDKEKKSRKWLSVFFSCLFKIKIDYFNTEVLIQ